MFETFTNVYIKSFIRIKHLLTQINNTNVQYRQTLYYYLQKLFVCLFESFGQLCCMYVMYVYTFLADGSKLLSH